MANIQSGQLLAILSASLFGISPVLCKLLIGDMSPALLAGLLYIGSGVGLEIFLLIMGVNPLKELRFMSLGNRLRLPAAIASGGMIAPLCLTYGIKYGNASEVTLLLNLETVFTTIISWMVFREQISGLLWAGKILIIVAAAGIVIEPSGNLSLSLSGILIVSACLFWGIDNNLTRDIEELSSVNLAGIKGLAAGACNIALAFFFTTGEANLIQTGGALLTGAFSYGLSLVLFIEALRRIGAARTSTFFTVGPFIGTIFSVIILKETEPPSFWIAMILMLIGVFLLCIERHGHIHSHGPIFHRHSHIHDDHHRHIHVDGPPVGHHEHPHNHEPLTHIHKHWPDIHHRHEHQKGKDHERSSRSKDR